MRLRLLKDSGREPSAATNGAGEGPHFSGGRADLLGSASLPEYFRARRVLIYAITAAIHYAANSEGDPEMRSAWMDIAIQDAATLDALEKALVDRMEFANRFHERIGQL